MVFNAALIQTIPPLQAPDQAGPWGSYPFVATMYYLHVRTCNGKWPLARFRLLAWLVRETSPSEEKKFHFTPRLPPYVSRGPVGSVELEAFWALFVLIISGVSGGLVC